MFRGTRAHQLSRAQAFAATILLTFVLSPDPVKADHCGKDFREVLRVRTNKVHVFYPACKPYLYGRGVKTGTICSRCKPFFIGVNSLAKWLSPLRSCVHASTPREKHAMQSLFSLWMDVKGYLRKCN